MDMKYQYFVTYQNTDVLIIDASKGFIKEGKNNKLRQSDICLLYTSRCV